MCIVEMHWGATDAENAKEPSMKLKDWEVTIQKMIDESNYEPKESGKQKILMAWRDKLAKDPYLLPLYQIDEIVREVRNRFKISSQQPSTKAQPTLATAASLVRLSP